MGQILEVSCPKCKYKETINQGQGIRFNKLESVLNLFDEKSGEIIKRTAKGNESIWSVYIETGECSNCKRIVETAVFTAKFNNGKSLGVKSKCSCGTEVRLISSEEALSGQKKIKCPKCSTDMEIKVVGSWD